MTNVTFEEEALPTSSKIINAQKQSFFVRILIKTGVAKTAKEAENILLVSSIVGIVLAVIITLFSLNISQVHVSQAQENATRMLLEKN